MNIYMNIKTKKTNIGGGNTMATQRSYIHPLKDIYSLQQTKKKQIKKKQTKKKQTKKKQTKKKSIHVKKSTIIPYKTEIDKIMQLCQVIQTEMNDDITNIFYYQLQQLLIKLYKTDKLYMKKTRIQKYKLEKLDIHYINKINKILKKNGIIFKNIILHDKNNTPFLLSKTSQYKFKLDFKTFHNVSCDLNCISREIVDDVKCDFYLLTNILGDVIEYIPCDCKPQYILIDDKNEKTKILNIQSIKPLKLITSFGEIPEDKLIYHIPPIFKKSDNIIKIDESVLFPSHYTDGVNQIPIPHGSKLMYSYEDNTGFLELYIQGDDVLINEMPFLSKINLNQFFIGPMLLKVDCKVFNENKYKLDYTSYSKAITVRDSKNKTIFYIPITDSNIREYDITFMNIFTGDIKTVNAKDYIEYYTQLKDPINDKYIIGITFHGRNIYCREHIYSIQYDKKHQPDLDSRITITIPENFLFEYNGKEYVIPSLVYNIVSAIIHVEKDLKNISELKPKSTLSKSQITTILEKLISNDNGNVLKGGMDHIIESKPKRLRGVEEEKKEYAIVAVIDENTKVSKFPRKGLVNVGIEFPDISEQTDGLQLAHTVSKISGEETIQRESHVSEVMELFIPSVPLLPSVSPSVLLLPSVSPSVLLLPSVSPLKKTNSVQVKSITYSQNSVGCCWIWCSLRLYFNEVIQNIYKIYEINKSRDQEYILPNELLILLFIPPTDLLEYISSQMLTTDYFVGTLQGDVPSATDFPIDELKQIIKQKMIDFYESKGWIIDEMSDEYPEIMINPETGEEVTPTEDDPSIIIGMGFIDKCLDYFFTRFVFYICFHFLLDSITPHIANTSKIPFIRERSSEVNYKLRGGCFEKDTTLLLTDQLFVEKRSINDILTYWTENMKTRYILSSDDLSVYTSMVQPIDKLTINGYFAYLSLMFDKLKEEEQKGTFPLLGNVISIHSPKTVNSWRIYYNSVSKSIKTVVLEDVIGIIKQVGKSGKYGILSLYLILDTPAKRMATLKILPFINMRQQILQHSMIFGGYDELTDKVTIVNSWGNKNQYNLVSITDLTEYMLVADINFNFMSSRTIDEILTTGLFI